MKLLLTSLSFLLYSICWSCTTHMIIYQIAITDIGTDLQNILDTYLAQMIESDANYKNYLEYACWADDMKDNTLTLYNGYHIVRIPFYDKGVDPKNGKNILDFSFNINATIINIFQNTFKGNTFQEKYGNISFPFEKSFMLRFLLNLVGDLHQPLNTINRITPEMLDGDQNGIKFPVQFPSDKSITNLHDLWDKSLGKIQEQPRPIQDKGQEYIMDMSKNITAEYTRDSLAKDLAITDWNIMTLNMNKLAISNAYTGITENTVPTDDYINTNWEMVRKMIALSGYRLADGLKKILQSQMKVEY